MKKFNKTISVLFAVLFLLSNITVASYAMSGTGTEANPYLISTANDLMNVNNDVTAYYKLTANIDLQNVDFTPIGNTDTGEFSGVFDGNGYTISNLNVFAGKYAGLFGYNEGTIKNVKIANAYVYGTRYIGGVVGYNSKNGVLENCKNLGGEVSSDGGLYDVEIGGICGYNEGNMNSSFENRAEINFSFSSSQTESAYIGGAIGYNAAELTLTNCSNYGEINGGLDKYSGFYTRIGGLVGYSYENITFEGCFNKGSLSGNNSRIGGLCGYCSQVKILNCSNTGDVVGGNPESVHSWAGGLIGTAPKASVNNSFNTGNIKCWLGGGIIGDSKDIEISKSYNTGNIQGYISDSGGIVGGCYYATINCCFNSGNTNGSGFIGDVYLDNESTISNSYNSGNVYYYAFGEGPNCNTYCCYNSGKAKYFTGGKSVLSYCFSGSLYEYEKEYTFLDRNQMQNASSFSDWDFDEVWKIEEGKNGGFPVLRCMDLPIKLDKSNEACFVGDTINLTAYKNGTQVSGLKWSCTDNVMVSSSGVVVALSSGYATVSAIDSEGNRANCNIRIMQKTTSFGVNDFSLNANKQSKRNVDFGNTSGTDFLVEVTSSNPGVVRIDDFSGIYFKVTAKSAGTAVLSFKSYQGATTTCTATVTNYAESLYLNKSSATIEKGETVQLTASTNPSPTSSKITWYSENTDIAVVDQSGLVTGVTPGTVNIWAETDNGYTDFCQVKVIIKPEQLSIEEDEITMYLGESYLLTPDVEPLDFTEAISFSSSSSFLSLSSQNSGRQCLITAQSTGTYTVRAYYGDLSDTVKVTVVPTPVVVTGIDLNVSQKSMLIGEMYKLSATITPSNSTDKNITWTSSDESVATVKYGMVTAKGEGSTVITVTASNGVSGYCLIVVADPTGTLLPTIYINDIDATDVEYFDVPIRMKNNIGISTADFSLSYNSEKVEPVSIRNGIIFDHVTSSVDKANSKVNLYFAADEDITGDGVLATVRFKVNSFDSGNADIKVCYTVYSFVTSSSEYVSFDCNNGDAIIACSHWNTEIVGAVPCDCCHNGYTGDTYCNGCGKTLSYGADIQMKGHKWSEWNVEEEPSLSEDGMKDRLCSVCGTTEQQVIEKLTRGIVSDRLIYGFESNVTAETLSDYFNKDYISVSSTPVNGDNLGTGSTICLNYENTEVDYTLVIFGDVNGDGWYDGMDSMLVNCIANGMLTREQVGEAVWTAADCNHDGEINQADVDLLNEAGLLLSQVDQTKSEEELNVDSVYQEYLSLIDQSPIAEEDSVQESEMPVKEDAEIIDFFMKVISKIIEFIKSYFVFIK